MLDPYYSKNNWIAGVESDRIIIDPMWHDKGKFVVTGWNPLGEYRICNQLFDNTSEAKQWILDIDSKVETVIVDNESACVYMCFDATYWWSSPAVIPGVVRSCYHKLFAVYDLSHAVKMVENTLCYLRASDGIPF